MWLFIRSIDRQDASISNKLTIINTMDLQIQNFSEIDLSDTFFDSLKESYSEFDKLKTN